jgi:plastocyanin
MKAVAAIAVLGISLVGGGSAVSSPPPSRVQVTAKEFYFALSRRTVAPGHAIVELVNYGEDPHDLRLQRAGGRLYSTPVVQPGRYYDLSLTLVPGTYRLWCGVANHRALGMTATLVVRKK